METQENTTRIFKVIQTYPTCPFEIGLELIEEATSKFIYLKNGVKWITYIVKIDNYPHLFKKI